MNNGISAVAGSPRNREMDDDLAIIETQKLSGAFDLTRIGNSPASTVVMYGTLKADGKYDLAELPEAEQ